MLVFLRGFGQEGEEVFSRVIFVVGDLACHRPEIGVDIEEIHVDGHLNPVLLEIFPFIRSLHDNDLAVSDGGDQCLVSFRNLSVRNPMEPENEKGEHGQDTKDE